MELIKINTTNYYIIVLNKSGFTQIKNGIDVIDLLNASDAFRKPLENPRLNLSKPVIVVIFTIF